MARKMVFGGEPKRVCKWGRGDGEIGDKLWDNQMNDFLETLSCMNSNLNFIDIRIKVLDRKSPRPASFLRNRTTQTLPNPLLVEIWSKGKINRLGRVSMVKTECKSWIRLIGKNRIRRSLHFQIEHQRTRDRQQLNSDMRNSGPGWGIVHTPFCAAGQHQSDIQFKSCSMEDSSASSPSSGLCDFWMAGSCLSSLFLCTPAIDSLPFFLEPQRTENSMRKGVQSAHAFVEGMVWCQQ